IRRSVSFSSGRVRSIRSPLVFAASAASARRVPMDLAMSRAVVPLGTSLTLPSGSFTWMLSAIGWDRVSAESFQFIGGGGEGQTPEAGWSQARILILVLVRPGSYNGGQLGRTYDSAQNCFCPDRSSVWPPFLGSC